MKARLEGFNLVIKTHIEHGCRHPTPVIYSIHRAEPGAAPFFKPGNARRSIVTSLFRARAPKGDYPMMNTRRNDDANNPANTSKKKTRPYQYLASFSSISSMDHSSSLTCLFKSFNAQPNLGLVFSFCLIIFFSSMQTMARPP